jgi:hypothetical protein
MYFVIFVSDVDNIPQGITPQGGQDLFQIHFQVGAVKFGDNFTGQDLRRPTRGGFNIQRFLLDNHSRHR